MNDVADLAAAPGREEQPAGTAEAPTGRSLR